MLCNMLVCVVVGTAGAFLVYSVYYRLGNSVRRLSGDIIGNANKRGSVPRYAHVNKSEELGPLAAFDNNVEN